MNKTYKRSSKLDSAFLLHGGHAWRLMRQRPTEKLAWGNLLHWEVLILMNMLVHFWLLCGLSAVVAPQDVTQQAQRFLEEFNRRAEDISYENSIASWNYNTNITEENANKMVSAPSCILTVLLGTWHLLVYFGSTKLVWNWGVTSVVAVLHFGEGRGVCFSVAMLTGCAWAPSSLYSLGLAPGVPALQRDLQKLDCP